MRKNIFKKTIVLTYLAIFLFGLFVPLSQSFGQTTKSIKITTNHSGTAKVGDIVTIVAETFGATKSEEVRFFSWPEVTGFQGTTCKTKHDPTDTNIWFCYVEFNSLEADTYTINASFTEDNKTYQAKTLDVVVEAPSITTSSLTSTSVTLGAEKLPKNSDVVFSVGNADSLTPSYYKKQTVKSDAYGKASSSPFINLSPGGKYVAMVETAKINFATLSSSIPSSTNPLSISTNNFDFSAGKVAMITAQTYVSGSTMIKFESDPIGGKFDSDTCVTQEKTCSVKFTSSSNDGFNIIAYRDFKQISSNIISANGGKKTTPPEILKPGDTTPKNTETTYTPLAPLPGQLDASGNVIPVQTDAKCTIDEKGNKTNCTNPCPFGNYLNIIIKLVLGMAAVLAMIMIVMGGVEYITTDLISSKEEGKERITHAILGLLLALGAYMILNTINPQLLSACLDKLPQAIITVGGPDSGDNTVDPDFAKGLRIYSTGTVSPKVSDAVKKLNAGWKISKFTVHAKTNGMTIELMKGNESNYDAFISISPGSSGYAPVGSGTKDDHKTPYGNWKILSISYTPGQAQFNKKGSNMGAAFWLLDPMTSGERGIGIHGNKAGTLGATNGCIRLTNADILALEPYITTGIPVSVVD